MWLQLIHHLSLFHKFINSFIRPIKHFLIRDPLADGAVMQLHFCGFSNCNFWWLEAQQELALIWREISCCFSSDSHIKWLDLHGENAGYAKGGQQMKWEERPARKEANAQNGCQHWSDPFRADLITTNVLSLMCGATWKLCQGRFTGIHSSPSMTFSHARPFLNSRFDFSLPAAANLIKRVVLIVLETELA